MSPCVRAAQGESCGLADTQSPDEQRQKLETKLLDGALRYARENTNASTGFVVDTVDNYEQPHAEVKGRASISSTGFMMALMADLYVKGKISRDEAYDYCAKPIRTVVNKTASDAREPETAGTRYKKLSYKGWYSHYIDAKTGDRWKKSEYAVTDSVWFVAGAIVCAQVFPDAEFASLVERDIYGGVNFRAMMTDGGAHPLKRTLSLSYKPESGYSKHQWDIYQHSWLVYLLGLGSPKPLHRLPREAWSAWDRTGTTLDFGSPELDGKVLYGSRRALFSHYFPDVFLDPRSVKDSCGIDYFQNSVLAVHFNQWTSSQEGTENARVGLWGLDAGPNPKKTVPTVPSGTPPTVAVRKTARYKVNTPYRHDTNVCPACAVAAAEFVPDVALDSLAAWCNDPQISDVILGRYGPANGLDLDHGWVAPTALAGIIGPMALSVANIDDATSVWRIFGAYPRVKDALAEAAKAPAPVNGCLVTEPAAP